MSETIKTGFHAHKELKRVNDQLTKENQELNDQVRDLMLEVKTLKKKRTLDGSPHAQESNNKQAKSESKIEIKPIGRVQFRDASKDPAKPEDGKVSSVPLPGRGGGRGRGGSRVGTRTGDPRNKVVSNSQS